MRSIASMTVLLLPMLALALPPVGGSLPPLQARDVEDQPRDLLEQIHPRGSLIVAITERGASNEMRAWFTEADARKVAEPRRISVLSLRLPFFISDSQARDKAKEEVPQRFWSKTLLDKDGKMAEQLGLGKSDLAWAIVVAPGGKILAIAHGKPDSPEAQAIWRALETGQVQREKEEKRPAGDTPGKNAPMQHRQGPGQPE